MQAAVYKDCLAEQDNTTIALLNFPIACLKITSADEKAFTAKMGELIMRWKNRQPGANTCNLIITKDKQNIYNGYIIYRNPDHRTPAELTEIKSEGVGIIEVAGEGIYPVPANDQLMHKIKNNGLDIIKGIIAGNNPIKYNYLDFFQSLVIAKE